MSKISGLLGLPYPESLSPFKLLRNLITIEDNFRKLGWYKWTVLHEAFQVADVSVNYVLFTLPATFVVERCFMRHSEAFGGGSISAYALSLFPDGSPGLYISTYDAFVAPTTKVAGNNVQDCQDYVTDTDIILSATSTDDNLSASISGSVDIWFKFSRLQ